MADLQVRVAADVASAISALQKIEKELDRAKLGADNFGKGADNAAKGLAKLPQSANQAGTAVGNLSRIVQDAPFGFIAISNNLQPLFDNFTQLKQSTGSVGGALKGLLGAIAGPAGIGLAFAAATSLVTVFSKEIFGSGQAAKKAKDEVAEFNKSLDDAQASALSSGLQLQKFVEIAKNGNLPLQQRNEALSKANDILGQYGEKLTLTNVATARATELVNQYTQGLIAQALANQLADRAATLLINQANAQKAVTEAQTDYNKAQAAFINRPQLTLREQELGRGLVYITQRDNALKALNQRQEEYANITKEITGVTTLFNEQALKSTNLLGGVGQKVKGGKVDVDFEVIPGISNRSEFEAKLAGGLPTLLPELDKAIKNIKTDPEDVKVPLRLNLTSEAIDFQKILEANGKAFESFVQTINDSVANIQVTGLASIGEAIGTALTGGDLQSVFQSFANVIAQGLESIGKQLIVVSGVAKLAKDALATLFTNPGAALAAGIALVAVSTALRQSLNKGVQARALGGPVSGGQPYLVGERGPELFVPQVSGGIVPNNQVGSMMGGRGNGGGSGMSVLRGQDILLAYARTQRSQLRVNG
jgi:hypothetical protein